MNRFRINYRFGVLSICLLLAIAVQAQDYGALQYMLQKRPANEKFQNRRFGDHLFFSAGVGMNMLLTDSYVQDNPGMNADFYFGKWWTPVHGLRLGASLGILPSAPYQSRIKMAGGKLDYLLNLSALTYGYNESRVFELLALAGIEGGYSRRFDNTMQATPLLRETFYYGVRWGIQGNMRLSNTLDLYLEPVFGIYNDEVAQVSTWRNYRVKADILLGLTYTPAASMGRKVHWDAFEKKPFFQHTFITVAGGIAALKVPSVRNTVDGIGPMVSIGVGKWFTPASGVRVSGTAGYNKAPGGSASIHLKEFGIRADYMLNFNNVLWGYDEDRLFTLAGVAGMNFAITKGAKKQVQFAPGIGVGLQGSFRLNRSVDLFVEPRLNVFTKRFANGVGLGNSDQLGEILLGVTYHNSGRAERGRNGFSNKNAADNLFMTTGIGAQLFLNKTNLKKASAWGPQMTVSIGKWFSPFAGLRLVGTGGYFTNYDVLKHLYGEKRRHASVGIGLDYLWNITSSMAGYNPDRIFELIGSLGAHMAFTSKMEHKWQPGVNAGLQGVWHLNDFLGLYLEPQVRLYGDNFSEGNLHFVRKDVMVAFLAGFHYRFDPYSRDNNRKMFAVQDKRYFISISAGTSGPLAGNKDLFKKVGYHITAGFAKWYTPLSALRINASVAGNVNTVGNENLFYGGLGADYMMSLATLAKGYGSESIIDVVPFVGVTMGVSHRFDENKFIPGIDAGAHLKFILNPYCDLFIEPRFGFRTDSYDGLKQRRADRVASLQAGFMYKF